MNTYMLLRQSAVWQTRDGMPIPLDEMDPQHRANTLRFLRRRADYLRTAYYWVAGRIFAEAPDEVWAQHEQDMTLALEPPAAAWLETKPLIIELARLVRKDELDANSIDGEVVSEEEIPRRGRLICDGPDTDTLRASFERRAIQ
jgi:hypothetical protein